MCHQIQKEHKKRGENMQENLIWFQQQMKQRYQLTISIMRCAYGGFECDQHIERWHEKRIRYYACSQFRNKGACVCSANSIRADVAEKRVRERSAAYISQPGLLQQLSERLESHQMV